MLQMCLHYVAITSLRVKMLHGRRDAAGARRLPRHLITLLIDNEENWSTLTILIAAGVDSSRVDVDRSRVNLIETESSN